MPPRYNSLERQIKVPTKVETRELKNGTGPEIYYTARRKKVYTLIRYIYIYYLELYERRKDVQYGKRTVILSALRICTIFRADVINFVYSPV